MAYIGHTEDLLRTSLQGSEHFTAFINEVENSNMTLVAPLNYLCSHLTLFACVALFVNIHAVRWSCEITHLIIEDKHVRNWEPDLYRPSEVRLLTSEYC